MTDIVVDATTLVALGTIGELDRLEVFEGTPTVLPAVRAEVTTEPAATNLDRSVESGAIGTSVAGMESATDRARSVLDASTVNGDVQIVAAVLAATDRDDEIGVVSDDRRVRTVTRGLGATVTGTVGVIVRAVEEGLSADAGTRLLRRVDENGLHMTAELRDRAEALIEDAAQ